MDDFLNLSESLISTPPKKRILWQLIHSWGFIGLSHIHLLCIYNALLTLDNHANHLAYLDTQKLACHSWPFYIID